MSKRRLSWMAAAGIATLALAACREDYSSARIAVPDPTPPALLAETEYGLPYAQPAPVGWYEPERGYAWAERAYGMQRAFYDAPPDYAFEYGGYEPWVWETADDWAMYAEPWDDGYRYYYYEPDAAYPYFVHDGDYGYAFSAAGLLIALFDSDGDYLPASYYYRVAPLAGRYYAHGRDLRNYAIRAPHRTIAYDTWYERAPVIVRTSEPWLRAAREDDHWRAWRDRSGERELKRFVKEERRRDRARASWERFQRDDFRRQQVAVLDRPASDDGRRGDDGRRFAEVRRNEERRAQTQALQAQRNAERAERQDQERRQFGEAQRQQQAQAQRRNDERRQAAESRRQRQEAARAQRQNEERRQFAEGQRQQREAAHAQRQNEERRQFAEAQRQQREAAHAQRQNHQRQQFAEAQRQQREAARGAEAQGRPAASVQHSGGDQQPRADRGARQDQGGGRERGGNGKGGGRKD